MSMLQDGPSVANTIYVKDTICLSETKCDEADMNNVKVNLLNVRFALSRYKSRGLLIGEKNDGKLKWKMLGNEYETLLTIKVRGRMLCFREIY